MNPTENNTPCGAAEFEQENDGKPRSHVIVMPDTPSPSILNPESNAFWTKTRIICVVMAIVVCIGCGGGAIWYFCLRGKESMPTPSSMHATPEKTPSSLAATPAKSNSPKADAVKTKESGQSVTQNNRVFKMIFYDFDQTITVNHLYHELRRKVPGFKRMSDDELRQIFGGEAMSDDRLYEIFGGKERVEQLKHHFGTLKAKGIRLSILSFNFCAVIEEALRRMGLLYYFDGIFGIDSVEMTHGQKYIFLQQKAEEYHNECDIWFVDDDKTKIDEALSTKCCKTVLIKERKGMTESDFTKIEKGLIGC